MLSWMVRRRRAVARLLLALVLTPWLVLGSAGAALAESGGQTGGAGGDDQGPVWTPMRFSLKATFAVKGVPVPDYADCTGHYVTWLDAAGESGSLRWDAECAGWRDLNTGSPVDAGKPYEYEVRNSGSAACASGTEYFSRSDKDSWTRIWVEMRSQGVDFTTSCEPVELCFRAVEGFNLTGHEWSCVAIEVPELDETGECEFGTPIWATARHLQTWGREDPLEVLVKDEADVRFFGDMDDPEMNEWRMIVFDLAPQDVQYASFPPYPQHSADFLDLPVVRGSSSLWEELTPEDWKVTYRNSGSLAGSHNGLNEYGQRRYPFGIHVHHQSWGSLVNERAGYTKPSECHFWFGPKVRDAEHPSYGDDDPWGDFDDIWQPDDPLPDPGDPGDPPAPPEDGSPTPDESDWWKALWEMLKQIVAALVYIGRAIAALPALIGEAIVSALGALVDALFVPPEGHGRNRANEIGEAWSETGLGQWGTALGDLPSSTGEVSGCGGMPVQFQLPGGVEIDETLGAACSGSAATAASLVRSVVSAALVVGGGLTSFRLIGAGFGYSPSVGRVDP